MTQTTLKPSKTTAPKKRIKPASDDENSSESDHCDDESLLSNTPPNAKRQKKAPAPKKSNGKPLQPIQNESHVGNDMDADERPSKSQATAGKKEQYQKVPESTLI